jgi:hypothetical protein
MRDELTITSIVRIIFELVTDTPKETFQILVTTRFKALICCKLDKIELHINGKGKAIPVTDRDGP